MNEKELLGSQTAKNGFSNEIEIVEKFNSWRDNDEAKIWLTIMRYKLNEIESVRAVVLHGNKADINVQVQIKLKKAIDVENIQVKLVSSKKGFNQIDKRNLKNYKEMWNIPQDVLELLQYFTDEKLPYKDNVRDYRRMFFDETTELEQKTVLQWFKENKFLILSDIIKGRGKFAAEWILVAQKVNNNARWIFKNINEVLNFYSQGDVQFSPKGSLKIGKITMQRKGGDAGRDTAKILQFKLDPTELFLINNK